MSATAPAAPARACPRCLGRRAGVLHHQPFVLPDGHPLGAGYDVVCCETCGFVYADTRASQAEYDAYYTRLSKYEDRGTGTGGGGQPWDDARLRRTAEAVASYVPGPEAKVVDVGCANGGLLRHLGAMGFRRLVGVDPSPGCAAAAGSLPHVQGFAGSLFALPNEARGADAVILSHVLEHLEDVRGGMARARALLQAGGLVYLEVPDATRYADCLAAPFQDFNTEHVNHFGPASLAALLEREGFEPLALRRKTIEAAPGIPYPAVWAVGRLVEDGRAEAAGTPDRELRPAVLDYVLDSDELMRSLDESLAPLAQRGAPILVWGAGQLTFKLLAMTRLRDVPIRAFLDANPAARALPLRGVPVLPPEAVTRFAEPVLIGTLLHADAIEARVRELGAPNPVIRLGVS